ncbi:hypothetical protein Z949_4101 [Sulfitobacter guttiformis KCTC 32187]|nr:hypothetical protein Z949_4101 [Sulfitobacter guttiformis KCTC 32187]
MVRLLVRVRICPAISGALRNINVPLMQMADCLLAMTGMAEGK